MSDGHSRIVVVDNFLAGADNARRNIDPAALRKRFDDNVRATGSGAKVEVRHGDSAAELRRFPPEPRFDLVSIDGGHRVDPVLPTPCWRGRS